MQKILLISNYVFHYRQKVYNYFFDAFQKDGYEFHVYSDSFQDVGYQLKFVRHDGKLNMHDCKDVIREVSPIVVILFLHLKDKIEIPLIHYCKYHRIKVIFWNKGLSDTDPDSKVKNILYHHIHNNCDALITYTPDMCENFQEKNKYKLFVGFNTVDCTDIDKSKYDKEAIKRKYNITEKHIVLYISRFRHSKRPEVLIDALGGIDDVALVMMGADMDNELKRKITQFSNIYYIGQKYGDEGNEIWAIGDIFSIPVSCGLGINEAIFWDLPIITMKGFQPPEIYFLKDGKTGLITSNEVEYKAKLLEIVRDDKKLAQMRLECQLEYNKEVCIENMYSGFIQAITYVERQ